MDSTVIDDATWTASRLRAANAGAAMSTGMAYLAQALSLITVPLYLKFLGQEQYGLMLLLVTLQTYLGQTNLGLNWAAMNMIGAARAANDAKEFVVVVHNAVLLGLLTAGIAFVASCGIALLSQYGLASVLRLEEGIDPWAIVAVGSLSAITLASGPIYLTFVGMSESSTSAFYQGLGRLLSVPVMLLVAWRGGGIAQMFAANATVLTLIMLMGAAHLIRRFPAVTEGGFHVDRSHCWRQLRMGIKNVSAELGFLLHATAPALALGVTCGAAAVPLYAVPKSLLDTALTFGKSQFSILQPAYAEAARHGRTAAMAQMLSRTITRNLTLLGILIAGFIVLCDPFVGLWTAGRLEVSRANAVAVAIGATSLFLVQLFQLFLVAIDRQLLAMRVLVSTGAISLLGAIAGGWLTGFYGVVYTSAAIAAAAAGVLGHRARSQISVAIPFRNGLSKCLPIAIVFAATLIIGLVMYSGLVGEMPQIVVIPLTGALMILCYAGALAGNRLVGR